MPLLEWLAYKKLRSAYLDIQSSMSKGWWPLAAIGILFYILITLLATYPTLVMNRPQYLLPLALLFVLMPVIYLHILTTLRKQQHTYQLLHQENILRLQVANLTERLMEISAADEKFRIERHNFRHKMQTIASLAETKQYSELMQVVNEYTQDIHDTQVKRYCHLPIVDAALVFYLQQAQEKEIQVSSSFIFPQSLPVSEAELATVLANALENAITACEKLPTADRFITIQVISTPRLMIHIRNSCDGNVIFNQEHLPITYEEGHGFGTRSIAAFCQKHNVFCEFAFQNNIFSLRLIFP